MTSAYERLVHWYRRGHIDQHAVVEGRARLRLFPSEDDWREVLDRTLCWLGAACLVLGVMFFFAYNWADMGRFAKLGLLELLFVIQLIGLLRFGLDSRFGKAALWMASALTGLMLALVGQIYQTGADTYELFGWWAVLILPWTILGRSSGLWLSWLAVANTAICLYTMTFHFLFGWIIESDAVLWPLFIFNSVAALLWELIAEYFDIPWMRRVWMRSVLVVVTGTQATSLALDAIFDGGWGLVAWLVWVLLVWLRYRVLLLELTPLAALVLSAVVVANAALAEQIIENHETLALFVLSWTTIGATVLGVWWLKRLSGIDPQRGAP